MNLTIKAFGNLTEITGTAELELEAQDSASLQAALFQKFPQLRERKFAIAVNKQLITENTDFKAHDVVALLPPFSGG
jgi:molybdopterin converting factor small subunit